MRALAGRLTLSPSDLNDYVECAHLTTLALEVARGGRADFLVKVDRPTKLGAANGSNA